MGLCRIQRARNIGGHFLDLFLGFMKALYMNVENIESIMLLCNVFSSRK